MLRFRRRGGVAVFNDRGYRPSPSGKQHIFLEDVGGLGWFVKKASFPFWDRGEAWRNRPCKWVRRFPGVS